MLTRIKSLLLSGEDFAFETTLSTRSYVKLLQQAKEKGHEITLLFFWLNSPALAIERVKTRVKEGGHHIPEDVIRRRYESGLINCFKLFQPIVNDWMFIDNSGGPYQIIATESGSQEDIINQEVWNELKIKYHGK